MGVHMGIGDMEGSYYYIVTRALEYLSQYISRGGIDTVENVTVYGDLNVNSNGKVEIPTSLTVKWGDGISNQVNNPQGMQVENDDIIYTRKVAGDVARLYKVNIKEGLPTEPNVIYLVLGTFYNNRFYPLYPTNLYQGHESQIDACKLDGIHKTHLTQYLGYQIAYHGTQVMIPDMFRIPKDKCIYHFSLHQIEKTNNLICDVDDQGLVTCKSNEFGKEYYGYLKIWVYADSDQMI